MNPRTKQLYMQYLKSYIQGRTGYVDAAQVESYNHETDVELLLATAEGIDDGMLDSRLNSCNDEDVISGPGSVFGVISTIEEKTSEEDTDYENNTAGSPS